MTKRLKTTPHPATRETTTRLGDWYANLIHLGRQQVVLAVSEKTLLSIVVPAAPSATLVPRMRGAVADVLHALGVSRADIRAEEEAMADVAYAKPTNRQALGILVDFAKTLCDLCLELGQLGARHTRTIGHLTAHQQNRVRDDVITENLGRETDGTR